MIRVSERTSLFTATIGQGGQQLLFVPGWSMSAEVFERQFAHFENSADVSFTSFDPRGQGTSLKSMNDFTAAARGRDIHCLLDALGANGVVLGGWSQGVHDVLSYIEQYGMGRLRAVILIDSAPHAMGDDKSREWIWYRRDDADNYRRGLTEDLVADPPQTSRRFANSMLERPERDDVDWITGIMLQMPAHIGKVSIEQGVDNDFEQTLIAASNHLPTLIVAAEEKKAVAEPWISANLPRAQFRFMGRHMMFWERSDEFNSLIDSFIESL